MSEIIQYQKSERHARAGARGGSRTKQLYGSVYYSMISQLRETRAGRNTGKTKKPKLTVIEGGHGVDKQDGVSEEVQDQSPSVPPSDK